VTVTPGPTAACTAIEPFITTGLNHDTPFAALTESANSQH